MQDRPISIHALLAESDIGPLIFSVQPRNFYPRSPCGERRQSSGAGISKQVISIHALLAESDEQTKALKIAAHGISIHALLAESDLEYEVVGHGKYGISIHALLAESDRP